MLSDEYLIIYATMLSKKFEKINDKYLTMMGEHIKRICSLSATDIHRLDEMTILGNNINQIQSDLAKASAKTVKEMRAIYLALALQGYAESAYIFNTLNMTQTPLSKNLALQEYIESMVRLTQGTFQNMSNTTVLADTYQELVDTAILEVSRGTDSFNSQMRQAIRKAGSGARVEYASGLTRRLDSAARMNIMQGVRETYMGIRHISGEQFGYDGVELSAHALCAIDHLPMQGKQFSLTEYEKLQSEQSSKDVNGKTYEPIRRAIGQWNCKHYVFPIKLGISKPAYTDKQLQEYKDNSNAKIEINGREYTRYECSQLMRQAETSMRYTKDRFILARAGGNTEEMENQRQILNKQRKAYRELCSKAGLPKEYDRAYVHGFK